MDDRLSKAAQRLGEALVQVATALGEFASAYLVSVADVLAGADWSALLINYAALNEAPPRVRHLAYYGKKHRTRKKNLHRALHKH